MICVRRLVRVDYLMIVWSFEIIYDL